MPIATGAVSRSPAKGGAARGLAALLALACLVSSLGSSAAAPSQQGDDPIAQSILIEKERQRTADELAAIASTITLTKEGIAKLDGEIAGLAADRNRISQAMIDAADVQKRIARDVAATEERIDALAGDEAGLKASLRSRRGLLAEVLAALERMGRKPPPALLVKPDDALGSVRSAILLGAVVPGIRSETEKLAGDLERLAGVKRSIAAEKERFAAQLGEKREEEARLSRLFAEKEKLEADSREARAAAAVRAAELAAKATNLQDLIATLDADASKARAAEEAARIAAAEAARRAEEQRVAEAEKARQQTLAAAANMPRGPDERETGAPPAVAAAAPEREAAPAEPAYDVASLRRDMARIEPAAAFSTMKGRLTPPVAGEVKVRFGESDGIGKPASGVTFAAHAGDVVTAPGDARVLYAGPFRSYGELLILDAGDGYHVVLAGMSRSNVEVGQFVLAGEPVAAMGAKRVASAARADFEATEPSLYVEFRKDGKPVDPTPFWAGRPSGRTRNDS
ncbi:murein hydrolase activator EnvC family protein [Aureimonas leprariae]|uniref:Peptidoglycan DD-metalloendopeptidase family protein n=1 Tax=Plantimonas leprariae TaxID=2615207 RepID=A0A7V7TXA2_9HYPH|nr:peptidoglycan DD-metalloendopeptidase family protein [Aureimonas leprariae]KAB0681294.1 peptidoglycan DD-metalloendopeptidase family protein [Aureimonas leprariae]